MPVDPCLSLGIAKRPVKNTNIRHATRVCSTHVTHLTYSTPRLKIGGFQIEPNTQDCVRRPPLRLAPLPPSREATVDESEDMADVATRPWRTPLSRAAGPGPLRIRDYVKDQPVQGGMFLRLAGCGYYSKLSWRTGELRFSPLNPMARRAGLSSRNTQRVASAWSLLGTAHLS